MKQRKMKNMLISHVCRYTNQINQTQSGTWYTVLSFKPDLALHSHTGMTAIPVSSSNFMEKIKREKNFVSYELDTQNT